LSKPLADARGSVRTRAALAAEIHYHRGMFRFAVLLLTGLGTVAMAQNKRPDNQPFPAYRVMGNIYYVGASDITSYLITTPAGHILINSGYEDTPPIIRDGILKLGFKLQDVKIILNGQAHFDHVAGQAEMQRLTGAKVYSSERDAKVIESGGKADPRWGREFTSPLVKVDHIVRDLEEVTLGGVTLVAHMTPGHSIGCTTWSLRVSEGGKVYDVVVVGGTTINPGVELVRHPTYPGIADDYAKAFRVLRALKCDVFLGAHGGYYGMAEKYQKMKGGAETNPFIDPDGYRAFVDRAEKVYLEQLARERGEAGAGGK
jgi:metallo-beta-lactamase class B